MVRRSNIVVGDFAVDISSFDFNDHSSKVGSVRAADISLITLVSIFVGLRLFVRGYLVRKIFIDDVIILFATAFTIALAVVCLAGTRPHVGIGTHIWLLEISEIFDIVKHTIQYLFICQILYACAVASTKIAITASYLRFIQEKKFRWTMYGTSFVILIMWITGVFVTLFQCQPLPAAWDFTIVDRKCINYINYLYASSAINVATDLILCILPWPYLWKLHMPRKQRIILCMLFGGGAGACLVSIIRIAYLHGLNSGDFTYQCVPSLNLSLVECSLGIICVSIPALRPLAARLWSTDMRSKIQRSFTSARSQTNSANPTKQSEKASDHTGQSPRNTSDTSIAMNHEASNSRDALAGNRANETKSPKIKNVRINPQSRFSRNHKTEDMAV